MKLERRIVDSQEWFADARLVALWAKPAAICAAYAVREGLLWLELPGKSYPDLSGRFPYASRMQRAAADLYGVSAEGALDRRPWLIHGDADYPFVRVEGEGVHEIPVGPVHAGIIEPGHFRFSIVGEQVLRLEQRLGYTHKGIDKRFAELEPLEAHKLAARVSGDSTVAFAWAYCMALESAAGVEIPARAAWLRALMLERERVANHLGDLGALGNDGGLAFGLAQFSRLREDWQRASNLAFGHRFMMDCVVPGGVSKDLDAASLNSLFHQCDLIERELRVLRDVYDEHPGLQDRFITAGRVTSDLAARLGLTGLAGRASAQALDLRCDHPAAPYDRLQVKMATHANGDVAARVGVRFEEAFESLRLIRILSSELPGGEARLPISVPQSGYGAGWIEGWRGEVFVALELDAGRISRCHCHDPSWQNWPVLEHAAMDNIVPDFPLINKSFNLSYSGHDL
ncbi:MAG TPA: Ni,Fe-hydrogenase III large subunit [Burkholderiales bacterium]|nr:Ni,Fe-hydrogenase III large subunit [Burkholderiales bacterium]